MLIAPELVQASVLGSCCGAGGAALPYAQLCLKCIYFKTTLLYPLMLIFFFWRKVMALYSVFSNSRGAVLTLSLQSMSHCWQPRIIPRAQMKSVINQGLCLGRKKVARKYSCFFLQCVCECLFVVCLYQFCN